MAETSFNWDKCLQQVAATDIGMRRANNQDSMTVVMAGSPEHWYQRGHTFIVADGMGGEAAGELASQLAVDTISHLYYKYTEQSPPEALRRAFIETNTEINRRGEANPEFHRMGTTCEVMLLLPQGVLLGHVGDSRIYRLRGDTLEQLTFDHSLVWELRASGQLEEGSDLASAVPKNWITRSLGPHPEIKVDIEGPYPTRLDDTFLLCSDGLTGKVQDEEIGPILRNLEPNEAAQVLIDLANLRGGPDNITVIIVKIIGAEITTAVARAEPLTVGGKQNQNPQKKQAAHPALWAIAGVSFLAAIGLGFKGYLLAALIGAIGGTVAAVIGVLQQLGSFGREPITLDQGRRLGRGPYTQTPCPDEAVIPALAMMVDELHEAIKNNQWSCDRSAYEGHCQEAAEAAEKQDHAKAVRAYCLAISQMMAQIREQQKLSPPSGDSTIDL